MVDETKRRFREINKRINLLENNINKSYKQGIKDSQVRIIEWFANKCVADDPDVKDKIKMFMSWNKSAILFGDSFELKKKDFDELVKFIKKSSSQSE